MIVLVAEDTGTSVESSSALISAWLCYTSQIYVRKYGSGHAQNKRQLK